MDEIKKQLIKDRLMEFKLGQEVTNRLMIHIEQIVDSVYLNPNGVAQEFDEWIENIPNGKLFEVVRTVDTFTAVPYKE